jgi:hypothetical protein
VRSVARFDACALDMGGLSGSCLLLDETVQTGLASTTRRELEGTRTSKPVFLSTHARLYQQGHVTTKGIAGHWCRLCYRLRYGTAATATCAPPPSSNALVAISTQRKCIYKAPMPYPHLSSCTSGGMSMTIAPPRGPTQKRRLGLQV